MQEISVKKLAIKIKELKKLEKAIKRSSNQKSPSGVHNRFKNLLIRWQSVLERAVLKDQRLKLHCEQWLLYKYKILKKICIIVIY